MASWTEELHGILLTALGAGAAVASDPATKPLLVDCALPLPPRLRVYLYALSPEGTTRYKSSLRLRGQATGTFASLDHSDGRFTVLGGYNKDLDIFVLWDAGLRPRFTNGGNVQVAASTVFDAAASGFAEQARPLQMVSSRELVIACTRRHLPRALERRIATTGGMAP